MDAELFNLYLLHYDNDGGAGDDDGGGDDDPPNDDPGDKVVTMKQKELDELVVKRTEKARKQQRETLKNFERLQKHLALEGKKSEALELEIEKLRKQTLTAEEIAKREAKKAKDAYEGRLTQTEAAAKEWERRYGDLKINYEITSASQKHRVVPQQIPFLESYLRPRTKLSENKDDDGNLLGHIAMIDFDDVGADGKPVQTTLSVDDTIKRMKELPDMYGHMFEASGNGGVGGSSGRPGAKGKGGFRSGMSQEEYNKLRKENPEALYNS